jgi:hypothetical protein
MCDAAWAVRLRFSHSARIWSAVEVVRGIFGTPDNLPGATKCPLSGVQSLDAVLDLVVVVEVLWSAKAVAEPAVDGAAQAPIRELEVVTMQIDSISHGLRALGLREWASTLQGVADPEVRSRLIHRDHDLDTAKHIEAGTPGFSRTVTTFRVYMADGR